MTLDRVDAHSRLSGRNAAELRSIHQLLAHDKRDEGGSWVLERSCWNGQHERAKDSERKTCEAKTSTTLRSR